MENWAIRARGLAKVYELYARPIDRVRELLSPTRTRYHQRVWALNGVDLEVARGSCVGLIGVNGAGKSTLLKIVAGKLRASNGTVESRGRISSILELGTGFQPHLTGRQNAFVNALFLGQRPWEARQKLDAALSFADIGDYADQPLATYSSGMQARLAFSVLTTLDPELLVLDEALATGDAGFAEKCKTFIRGLATSGCTTLLTSHDSGFVAEACDRVVWIDHGKVRADGEPRPVIRSYLEHLGIGAQDPSPRPKHMLLRIEAEDPTLAPEFCIQTFEWVGSDGKGIEIHCIGEDRNFLTCVAAAPQLGFPLASARAGWGPGQEIPAAGHARACRPSLGPGGAAFLALPVPAAPKPVPAKLRTWIHRRKLPTPAVLSVLRSGHFQEIGRVRPASYAFEPVLLDVSSFFLPEGTPAPPLERVADLRVSANP